MIQRKQMAESISRLWSKLGSEKNKIKKRWASKTAFLCTQLITHKAPTRWLQHANATNCNFVGCNMFRTSGHRVATCWVLWLRLASYADALWARHLRYDHFQTWANKTTLCSRVAKHTQHVANNVAICCIEMLRSFGRGLTVCTAIIKSIKWNNTSENGYQTDEK